MLDVHAPEHTPHTFRDFLLHILTITIGLLIALGLEAIVEWRHHVHLGREAVENMRREIEASRKEVKDTIAAAPGEEKNLAAILGFLHKREAGQKTDLKELQTGLALASMRDASWQTATATGALTYIPYEQAQRFAEAYQLQKDYAGLQTGALQPAIALNATLSTGDPNGMTPEDAKLAVRQVQAMMAQIEALREVGTALDKTYDAALKE